MVEREALLMKPKLQYHLSQWGKKGFILMKRMCLLCPIMKLKEIIMRICVCPNQHVNINSKRSRKKSSSCENEASISFIPIRKKCLSCLIKKWKEIIMWIRVCPNQQTNINFKNSRKKSFSYETKASISFITMRRICL